MRIVMLFPVMFLVGCLASEFPAKFEFNETEKSLNAHVSPKYKLSGSIAENAETWLHPPIPYSQQNWYNGYRTDCSGYVSMAWGLGSSYVTWTLPQVSYQINKNDLQSGDILLNIDEHVLIFDKWANSDKSYYYAYEQTPPQAVYHIVEYPYWYGNGDYVPYRYYYKPNTDDDNNYYSSNDDYYSGDDYYGDDDYYGNYYYRK